MVSAPTDIGKSVLSRALRAGPGCLLPGAPWHVRAGSDLSDRCGGEPVGGFGVGQEQCLCLVGGAVLQDTRGHSPSPAHPHRDGPPGRRTTPQPAQRRTRPRPTRTPTQPLTPRYRKGQQTREVALLTIHRAPSDQQSCAGAFPSSATLVATLVATVGATLVATLGATLVATLVATAIREAKAVLFCANSSSCEAGVGEAQQLSGAWSSRSWSSWCVVPFLSVPGEPGVLQGEVIVSAGPDRARFADFGVLTGTGQSRSGVPEAARGRLRAHFLRSPTR